MNYVASFHFRSYITIQQKWHGQINSPRGENHKSWWVSHRHYRFRLQNHNFSIHGAIIGDIQCFVYIKMSETNREKM